MGRQDQRIKTIDKDRQALELRKAGMSYDDIAKRLGWASKSGAHHAVRRSLDRTIQEPANELREVENARLDALFMAMFPRALTGNEKAVDRCVRIMERRAKLLGLDRPDVVDVKTNGESLNKVPDDKRVASLMALYERVRTRTGGTDSGGGDSVGSAEGAAG